MLIALKKQLDAQGTPTNHHRLARILASPNIGTPSSQKMLGMKIYRKGLTFSFTKDKAFWPLSKGKEMARFPDGAVPLASFFFRIKKDKKNGVECRMLAP